MTKLDNYITALQAIRDGKEIQIWYRDEDGWETWGMKHIPSFDCIQDFRIKPATVRYRVALFREPCERWYTNTLEDKGYESRMEGMKEFIRWLTDWIEVDVSE